MQKMTTVVALMALTVAIGIGAFAARTFALAVSQEWARESIELPALDRLVAELAAAARASPAERRP